MMSEEALVEADVRAVVMRALVERVPDDMLTAQDLHDAVDRVIPFPSFHAALEQLAALGLVERYDDCYPEMWALTEA